jgi:ABC-type multidrug transport system permease subunit
MRSVLVLAQQHIKGLFKDRTALILLVALPLVLSWVTGMAFGGPGAARGSYSIPIAFVDYDGGPIAEQIIQAMSVPPYAPRLVNGDEARELVRTREVTTALFIPPGLQDSLQANQEVVITVLRGNFRESPRMVEQHLNLLLLRIKAAAAAANLAPEDWLGTFSAAAALWSPRPPVMVISETITYQSPQIADGFNQASPGYVVMFGMMTVITAGGVSLLVERDNGTLRRLLASPVTKAQILAGKTLGITATGILQMGILITAGRLLFNVNWGANIPALALLVITLSIAATGIGMFLAAICRTTAQANAVGVLSVLVMAMLGGTWWPMEVMPRHMQVIAKMFPSGWAMEGFINIILRGASLGEVMLPVLVLLAFGLVFLALGTWLFRFE